MPGPAIGIDVGGTRTSALLVDRDGSVLARDERPTPADDQRAILATMIAGAKAVADDRVVGVGVAAAGLVDRDGVLRYAPNLAWREAPLTPEVEQALGVPTVADNDVAAAAWGEYLHGAGRGSSQMLLVSVGTGIGGGLVLDGRPFRGANGFAAEIGHVVVEPGGPRCGCGNLGCWEQVASGQALDRLAREAAGADPDGAVGVLAASAEATGRHVAAAADGGDAVAARILEQVGRRLGEGLAGLANVLDPEVIVVGGGVAEIGEALLAPARARFGETVEAPGHRPPIPILAAELGNDAGAIGAADLALEMVAGR